MLDLETMGNGPNAAIIAVGAVMFDRRSAFQGRGFYRQIDLRSSVNAGLKMDPDTVLWWLQQGKAARNAFKDNGSAGLPLDLVLNDFTQWLPKEPIVWGNGAAFDNVILASAYQVCNLKQPWKFWNDRCYRTIAAMHPDQKQVQLGTHHNALDDAISQAEHLIAIAPEAIL